MFSCTYCILCVCLPVCCKYFNTDADLMFDADVVQVLSTPKPVPTVLLNTYRFRNDVIAFLSLMSLYLSVYYLTVTYFSYFCYLTCDMGQISLKTLTSHMS